MLNRKLGLAFCHSVSEEVVRFQWLLEGKSGECCFPPNYSPILIYSGSNSAASQTMAALATWVPEIPEAQKTRAAKRDFIRPRGFPVHGDGRVVTRDLFRGTSLARVKSEKPTSRDTGGTRDTGGCPLNAP